MKWKNKIREAQRKLTQLAYLRKEELTEDIDFLREATELLYEMLIDLRAEKGIGPGPTRRSALFAGWRRARGGAVSVFSSCLKYDRLPGMRQLPPLTNMPTSI
jgi:hypothetical protein